MYISIPSLAMLYSIEPCVSVLRHLLICDCLHSGSTSVVYVTKYDFVDVIILFVLILVYKEYRIRFFTWFVFDWDPSLSVYACVYPFQCFVPMGIYVILTIDSQGMECIPQYTIHNRHVETIYVAYRSSLSLNWNANTTHLFRSMLPRTFFYFASINTQTFYALFRRHTDQDLKISDFYMVWALGIK
ncbi:hypothetical protein BDB01DRAFT_901242, partial [Pilobolus umbonatus]